MARRIRRTNRKNSKRLNSKRLNSRRFNSKRRSKVANRRNTMRRNTMRKNNKRRSKVANRKYMKRKTFGGMQRQTGEGPITIKPSTKHVYGMADTIGYRRSMEDCMTVYGGMKDNVDYFAVFDGHGGRNVSQFVAQTAHQVIESHADWVKSVPPIETILADSFPLITQKIQEEFTIDEVEKQGTTAVIVIIKDVPAKIHHPAKKMLYVANLGDTRAVIGGGGGSRFSTEDHKPGEEPEITRIRDAGWDVMNYQGTMRLKAPSLIALSRAFGDLGSRHLAGPDSIVLSDVPDVSTVPLQDTDKVLIIACDGLWDVMNNDEAVKRVMYLCSRGCSAEEAAFYLRDLALEYGSRDNISVMVVLLGEIAQDPIEKVSFFSNEKDGKLGTVFGDDWPSVKRIAEESLAGEQGKIVAGNAILAINGNSMNGKTFNDVKRSVKNRPLILTFSDNKNVSYNEDCDKAASNYPKKQAL